MTEYWLHIPINPEPWAVGPIGASRRGGKLSAYMGQNQQLHAYQEAVREELRTAFETQSMLVGKCAISVYFFRNRAEYTTPNQRLHRKHEADATNLLKAFEDAMQGIVFANDRDNIIVRAQIVEQGPNVTGQVIVQVFAEMDELAVAQQAIDGFPSPIHDAMRRHAENIATLPEDDNDWPPKDGITR